MLRAGPLLSPENSDYPEGRDQRTPTCCSTFPLAFRGCVGFAQRRRPEEEFDARTEPGGPHYGKQREENKPRPRFHSRTVAPRNKRTPSPHFMCSDKVDWNGMDHCFVCFYCQERSNDNRLHPTGRRHFC